MANRKPKALGRRNKRLLGLLQKAWVWHGGNIERAVEFSKITAREKLKSIEILFNPYQTEPSGRTRTFDVMLNHKQLKEFKRLNRWLHGGNRELKRAIKEMGKIHQRQYFRNYEVLKCLLKEANQYRKNFSKNSLLRKISSSKTEVGKDFRHYRRTRYQELIALIKEIKWAIKQINKSVFIDNLKGYIDAFEDFFVMEEALFKKLVDRSIDRVYEKNIEMVNRRIKEEGEIRFDLPSWNMFIEAE